MRPFAAIGVLKYCIAAGSASSAVPPAKTFAPVSPSYPNSFEFASQTTALLEPSVDVTLGEPRVLSFAPQATTAGGGFSGRIWATVRLPVRVPGGQPPPRPRTAT